jgi:hypothetical protein
MATVVAVSMRLVIVIGGKVPGPIVELVEGVP